MNRYDHLLDRAVELLDASKEERIEYVNEDKWIGYPKAKQILERLEDLIAYPKIERMPNLLIVGDSNNGKTQILKRFADRYQITIDEEDYVNRQPVIMISAPAKPDENAFLIRLLEAMVVPYAKNDSLEIKRQKVIRTMRIRETKMLIIDEIQHIIAGSYNAQKGFLNSIKDLSNTLKIPIIGAGIEDAFHAIQVDPQLANRFQVEVLERWKLDSRESRKAFAQLVASIEARLPLEEPSFLYKKPLVQQLHYLSDGLIGEVVLIIKQLASYAIKHDLPCIDDSVFGDLNLIPASKRKELLKRMR
ncbi:MAG: TniB family NTP-binding protein [Hydrogenovibrio sp.]|uniref:TniB family NTP-binding protein n=1 Tax=Hydrogenovibrio sp. TaxID=2065821 RepID=UPI00286FF0A6|nr:TniB family NTP-binding protein [Hydrogenovibrio sp.]MDR9498382.1 TniB family NTP-binding protein [Hydrogenovibrio sp.]